MVSLEPTADIPYREASAALRAHLGDAAASHCERTAEAARGLASRVGVDADAAALAGLLHDWSREDGAEALVEYARAAGLSILPEERVHPYLLHARVAAEQVRQAFPGIRIDVLSAIAAHTVGTVPMTPLDKVVYIADAIEPGRDYPGVEELRASAASEPLDEVFARAYADSVAFVLHKGAPLHPMTRLVSAQIERETGGSPMRAVTT